ncbi:MAG: hypothetical protein AABY68_09955 [Pseudomonadota bacterium]
MVPVRLEQSNMLQHLDAGSAPRSVSEERTTGIQGALLGIYGDNDFRSQPFTEFSRLKLPENFGIAIDTSTGEFKKEVSPGVYETDRLESLTNRYLLRAASKNLLQDFRKPTENGNSHPVYRVVRCGIGVMNEAQGVGIWKNTEFKSTHFGGLCTCGSIWQCAVCAPKISNRRAAELAVAISRNNEEGGVTGLLTCTIPHAAADRCADVLQKLQQLFTRLNSGRASQAFNSEFSIRGQVRAIEFTHGFHGWHPHVHALVFSETPLDWDLVGDEFYRRWSISAKKNFGWDLPRLSIDFRGGNRAAQYVNKWGIENELTTGMQKQGKGNSRSPWGLLADYASGCQASGEKWKEFATAVSRQEQGSARLISTRQLVWSRGLKDTFKINEVSDEEIAASQEEPAILLGTLSFEDWVKVLNQDFEARPVLLQIAALGSMQDVQNFVNQLPEPSKKKLII